MKTILPFLFILLAYASFAIATNSIRFINHCPYDIWYWTVGPPGSSIEGPDSNRTKIPGNHGSVIHAMVDTELLHGGISLKLRDLPTYQVAPAGIVQVEYNLEPSRNSVWYDLSVIDCDRSVGPNHPLFCPLVGGGIKMYIPNAKKGYCPPAWCKDNKCGNTYERHGSWLGEPSFKCNAGVDIFVEMCTERIGPYTIQDDPTVFPPDIVPEVVPQAPLKVSPGGTCGGTTGYTCNGSRWGDCCSSFGYCGRSNLYCNAGCQNPFGICPGANSTVVLTPSASPSNNIVVPSSLTTKHPTTFKTVTTTKTEMVTKTTTVATTTITRTQLWTVTVVPAFTQTFHYSPSQTASTRRKPRRVYAWG